MMLARQDLLRAWEKHELRFDPEISVDDLRLGYIFTKQKAQSAVVIRPAQDFDPSDHIENTTLKSGEVFRLLPNEFCLGQTLEKISLPAKFSAHVHGRSSLARSGLSVHATAPHIHPGFYGPITLEFFNCGKWELEFFPGRDIICQLILWEVKTPPPKNVIEKIGSYLGQDKPFPKRSRKK